MTRIVIDKSLLDKKLAEISNDDIQLIELCIVPSQNDNGILAPAFLHISGIDYTELYYKDYESIDAFSTELRLIKMPA